MEAMEVGAVQVPRNAYTEIMSNVRKKFKLPEPFPRKLFAP